MNCNSIPSHKPPISIPSPSLHSNNRFNFNHTHLKPPQISTRTSNFTIKASSTTKFRTNSPENETLYDLLGIPETGTLSEIKHAYKKMALKYHPDVSPPDRAEEYTVKFIRVQEAYETLSDPEARSVYDRCIAKGLSFGSGNRVEPGFEDKKRWREMWKGQLSELVRRGRGIRIDRVGVGGYPGRPGSGSNGPSRVVMGRIWISELGFF